MAKEWEENLEAAKEKYKDLSLSSITNSHGDRVILVVKADEEEQERLAGERDGAELSDLEAALGHRVSIEFLLRI